MESDFVFLKAAQLVKAYSYIFSTEHVGKGI